ncbi:MAG: phosphoenolpyruvate carboxykinase (ATP) [Candidatus Latescibacteria bacterium]|nr:phosphoenolpyruvate carboxykinase (ATP) [Candidatus Latescibacterota bacterium]NIM64525.1 phosphoenolpyruvate carboxykinase (ATP) [Candidatus Latescibacterota bacterium]NIO00678.1 phosphoenolpyruvate carboxykinase (ATP) [Candidatus Latescibacterota bacterium]NIO27081.1 phosphoenolpyruvate carboxykinase (ATP) [Candidatus Latescibacterota bacterium]NIO54605.1 phosphoenolpyruvate carboxykinase (ATP) [Candidatus Latescibacterota bacterium]
MPNTTKSPKVGLEAHGLTNLGHECWNFSTSMLYEEIVKRNEGALAHLGPIVVRTGSYTGRSPNDKFLVEEPTSKDKIWWGKVNRPFKEEKFQILFQRLQAYLQGRDVFVQDCHAGADPEFRLPVRIITERAWHSLFARNMFRQIADPEERLQHEPAFTVLNVPGFKAIPELDGTYSEAFIIVNFGKRLVLIGGTSYAGEIKKSIFTVLNFLLPQKQVMTMHCSANAGRNGDVAIFFGLSGTGKTTLSADPHRSLIGDDEHGWSDRGVFNFEGGCYAKVIRLSAESEPEIYETTRRFGTILENVCMNPSTRRVDLDDDRLTENTRAAYPITHIPNIVRDGLGGHPKNVIMLTADAFGIMPPISRLTHDQARYHFLSGYTAKVAGTERGAGSAPQATFSACFGAPFMALPPTVYSGLLGEKIKSHDVSCWLVNTGWSGGPVGTGSRMKIAHSRAMVEGALSGKLNSVSYERDPVFGLEIPKECPDVPAEVLNPRNTWKDKTLYDSKAKELVEMFRSNFKQFEKDVPPEIRNAGPSEENRG